MLISTAATDDITAISLEVFSSFFGKLDVFIVDSLDVILFRMDPLPPLLLIKSSTVDSNPCNFANSDRTFPFVL